MFLPVLSENNFWIPLVVVIITIITIYNVLQINTGQQGWETWIMDKFHYVGISNAHNYIS